VRALTALSILRDKVNKLLLAAARPAAGLQPKTYDRRPALPSLRATISKLFEELRIAA
jgi:hypothetical protein